MFYKHHIVINQNEAYCFTLISHENFYYQTNEALKLIR